MIAFKGVASEHADMLLGKAESTVAVRRTSEPYLPGCRSDAGS